MLNLTSGEKHMEKTPQETADAGVKVVSDSGVGNLALHYLDRMGIP